jgi:phage terminase large subunit-like protein
MIQRMPSRTANAAVADLLGQAGKVEIQFLTGQLGGYIVRASPVTDSKVDRASPVATQAEVGNVVLYRAGWNEPFLTELTEFPTGMHDDQVDAFSAAFAMFVDTTVGLYDWTKANAERIRRQSAELRAAMGLPPEATPLR